MGEKWLLALIENESAESKFGCFLFERKCSVAGEWTAKMMGFKVCWMRKIVKEVLWCFNFPWAFVDKGNRYAKDEELIKRSILYFELALRVMREFGVVFVRLMNEMSCWRSLYPNWGNEPLLCLKSIVKLDCLHQSSMFFTSPTWGYG